MLARTLLFHCTLFFLSACDYGILWQDDPYIVVWIDALDTASVSWELENGNSIGRIPETVIAVGSDERFIVAKQKNLRSDKISYFILDRKKDHKLADPSVSVTGSLTKEEYDAFANRLNLPQMQDLLTNKL